MVVTDLLTGLLPRPTIDEHACSRRWGSGCSVCIDACPKQALEVTGTGGSHDRAPSVDPLLCLRCGLCEAQCPSQAITGVAASPELLVGAAVGKETLRMRCEAARLTGGRLHTNRVDAAGLDVGCLAGLHPETVAAAAGSLAEGGAIELLHGDCEACPLGAGPAVAAMVEEARSCLSGTARIHVGRVVDEDGATETAERPTPRMTRRSLFRKASPRRMAEDAVQARASSADGVTPRGLLLRALTEPALPRPRVEAGCTACRACVQVCPKEALSHSQVDDVFVLSVDPARCVGCDECVRVCPEDVVVPSVRVPDAAPLTLASVGVHRCDSCSMPLSPGETESCAACLSRRSLVSDVWSQYGL